MVLEPIKADQQVSEALNEEAEDVVEHGETHLGDEGTNVPRTLSLATPDSSSITCSKAMEEAEMNPGQKPRDLDETRPLDRTRFKFRLQGLARQHRTLQCEALCPSIPNPEKESLRLGQPRREHCESNDRKHHPRGR